MTIKNCEYFLIALGLILAVAVSEKLIPFVTAMLVAIFAAALWLYDYFTKRNNQIGFYVSWSCAIVLGILVGIYRPHNFNYPMVFSVERFYDGGLPLSLYINVAKFFAGIIILYFLLSSKAIAPVYIQSRLKQFAFALLLAILVLSLAYRVLDLQFHAKELKYIILFGFANLIVTCLAEEAFMRLLLQAQIQKFISSIVKQRFLQELIPLIVTTFIFLLTHFVHGFNFILVFTVAGFGYGLVYSLTKNVWACIAVHFAVNIIHFSFLTYPIA